MKNAHDLSIGMAAELGDRVLDAGVMDNTSGFLSIRRELNFFLLSLSQSNGAAGRGQQIHFLFIALSHLDNIEKEIRISCNHEDVVGTERIYDKIRGLKVLILNYIKHLMSEC